MLCSNPGFLCGLSINVCNINVCNVFSMLSPLLLALLFSPFFPHTVYYQG